MKTKSFLKLLKNFFKKAKKNFLLLKKENRKAQKLFFIKIKQSSDESSLSLDNIKKEEETYVKLKKIKLELYCTNKSVYYLLFDHKYFFLDFLFFQTFY